jgi:peptidoglycan/LPS O-acetylase OafA/YrhL
MKDSKNLFKKLGMIGIGLCAACCLLPIIAVTFGVGALTALSAYFEWAGIVTMTIAGVLLAVYFFKKRNAPVCDVDCSCREDAMIPKTKR